MPRGLNQFQLHLSYLYIKNIISCLGVFVDNSHGKRKYIFLTA